MLRSVSQLEILTQTQLYADSPIFLITGQSYSREGLEAGAQIPGLSITDDGTIATESKKTGRIARWSLRPADAPVDFRQRWTPNSTVLQDGQVVALYCHSFRAGSFRDATEAPYYAPRAHHAAGDTRLKIPDMGPGNLTKASLSCQAFSAWHIPYKMTDVDINRALKTDTAAAQAVMDRFDRLKGSQEDNRDVDMVRELFGFRDGANARVNDRMQREFEWPYNNMTFRSHFDSAAPVGEGIKIGMDTDLEKWRRDTNMPYAASFRVRYV